MKDLRGKIVLVTGGSRGIGPVIAGALAKRGANLALAARSEPALRKTAEALAQTGATISTFPADLTESKERDLLVSGVMKEFGTIDILINNAGVETEGAYTELKWQSVRENIELNLVAPMALTWLILPRMIERKSGHIVNISSIAGKGGGPFASVYSGTKAGLAEWTRALRLELHGTGVKFSTIFPGYVREVGMFARFGKKVPWIIGSCSPDQVAQAVIKAIEKERIETIVNSMPLRYFYMLSSLSPVFGDWIMRKSGAVDFQRRKIEK
jgi:short-subunit dehydrogenase